MEAGSSVFVKMVVHLLSLAFTGFIVYISAPGSDLFSWHPTCMTVCFVLLMVQAIVLFSPESSLVPTTQRAEKVQLHWILHTFAVVSAGFGFAAVFLNKEVNNRKHFVSWHGKFGLATSVAVILAIIGGVIAKYSTAEVLRRWVKPINLKLYHATGAMLVFMLAMATVALACYSNWFKNRVEGWVWRLCFWTPVVLAVCVARQVTQSYLPRILEKRESELDAKARRIQSRIDAKLTKKATKKSSKSLNTTTSASVAKRKESESEKSL